MATGNDNRGVVWDEASAEGKNGMGRGGPPSTLHGTERRNASEMEREAPAQDVLRKELDSENDMKQGQVMLPDAALLFACPAAV